MSLATVPSTRNCGVNFHQAPGRCWCCPARQDFCNCALTSCVLNAQPRTGLQLDRACARASKSLISAPACTTHWSPTAGKTWARSPTEFLQMAPMVFALRHGNGGEWEPHRLRCEGLYGSAGSRIATSQPRSDSTCHKDKPQPTPLPGSAGGSDAANSCAGSGAGVRPGGWSHRKWVFVPRVISDGCAVFSCVAAGTDGGFQPYFVVDSSLRDRFSLLRATPLRGNMLTKASCGPGAGCVCD